MKKWSILLLVGILALSPMLLSGCKKEPYDPYQAALDEAHRRVELYEGALKSTRKESEDINRLYDAYKAYKSANQ